MNCEICNSENYVVLNQKINKYLCSKHNQQINKKGKIIERTNKDKNEIILYKKYAEIVLYKKHKEITRVKIDLNMVELINKYRWYLNSNGYAMTTLENGKQILLHKLIMNTEKIIDHKNRNKLDCRLCNLRECTQSDNTMNSNMKKNNTSGITGVWLDKRTNKWIAEIFVKGKKIILGRSINKQEVIKLRKDAEKQYFGEYAPSHKKEGDLYE